MKRSEPAHLPPLGILGGTFDPVHRAHLALAHAAREQSGLSEIRWIPAGRPWHRGRPGASAADRVAMVRAAIADTPEFTLDSREADRGAPGYTVDTLIRLRQEVGPARPLVLLMGADAFCNLHTWHRWQEIFDLAHLAIATRPGFPLTAFPPLLAQEFACRRTTSRIEKAAGSIQCFELVAGTVSATEIRQKLAAGADDATLLALLPGPVLDYIRANALYLS